MYRIQIFHPGSGFYLNTGHESDNLEVLKSLVNEPALAGPRYQIVDDEGVVHFGPVATERATPMSVEDLASALGVPIIDPREIGLLAEEVEDKPPGALDVGYTLEVIHMPDGSPIVAFELDETQAQKIISELWPNVNFWSAPGGSSMQIETRAEAETIIQILGKCWIEFHPERHRWLFHVHLT